MEILSAIVMRYPSSDAYLRRLCTYMAAKLDTILPFFSAHVTVLGSSLVQKGLSANNSSSISILIAMAICHGII